MNFTLFQNLREFSFTSVCFKMVLAMLLGGLLGINRTRKGHAAGFRTYMFVSLGAVLTMILSQYSVHMFNTRWADIAKEVGVRLDVVRQSAKVVDGIGFIGAGSIMLTAKNEVKGITTAAGLFASACLGFATGAGFYECVFIAFIIIMISIAYLPIVEDKAINNSKFLSLYVEVSSLEHLNEVLKSVRKNEIYIRDMEVFYGERERNINPYCTLFLNLPDKSYREIIIKELNRLNNVLGIEEI